MAYEVTIGIPVYNAEKYIRLMMDSALAQTFESIEFLICDDCGTDSSIDIVKEYQRFHPRGKYIRIVRQPKNMGIGHGRNRLIDEAQGKYLFFLDADDEIFPNTISLLYENAVRYQAEIVYGSRENIEDYEGQQKVTPYVYPSMQFLHEDEFPSYVYRNYSSIQAQTWNYLIEVDIYRRNHLRFMPVNFWEDFSMTIDLPTYITRAVLLPDITYRYYCRYGSLSNFQQRKLIEKEEILKTIDAMARVKANSGRIREKGYFPMRLYKVMMTHFYMSCSILKNWDIISPEFSRPEIRDIMRSPLSLVETMKLKDWRKKNLLLCLLGIFPPIVTVAILRMVGKYKKVI